MASRSVSARGFLARILSGALACSAALPLTGCGEADRGLSRYLPSEIEGIEVDRDGAALSSAEAVFRAGDLALEDVVVSGWSPDHDDSIPEVFLVGANGSANELHALERRLEENLGGPGSKVAKREVGGVEVSFTTSRRSNTTVHLAVARPEDEVAVVAYSLSGEERDVVSAIDAMLG